MEYRSPARARPSIVRPTLIPHPPQLLSSLYVSTQIVKLMLKKSIQPKGARVLMLGLTFKENCPDLRNTRVVDMIKEFKSYNADVDVYDPWVDADEAQREYGLALIPKPGNGCYDAVVLAVAHREFVAMGSEELRALCTSDGVLFDVKNILPIADSDGRL